MPRKKTSENAIPVERKTLTIPKNVYEKLSEWKGGERRGISFAEAIDRLLDHADATGYKSALAKIGK